MSKKNDLKNEILKQFKGFVRTPNLLENCVFLPYQNVELASINMNNVYFNDNEVAEISKHKYLGKRVELFFKKYLELQPNIKLITQGLQVIEEKMTLGEFDFMYCFNESYFHLELVYKQYIFLPLRGKAEFSSWVGPNKKDFLAFKLDKLKNKQFPLLHKAVANATIKSKLGLDSSNFEQRVCFKAQLYLHFDSKLQKFEGISPDAVVGKWYFFREFKAQDFNNHSFLSVKKQNWPVIPNHEVGQEWSNFSTIIQFIYPSIKEGRSVKLWRKSKNKVHQLFVIWEDADVT